MFAALLVSLVFSSVVTTPDSPRYMPCQDKSTIQRKSSVLSVDVWRVLSPGGPIFSGVSSNVFLAFLLFFVLFVLRGGEGSGRTANGRSRATASSKWLCGLCAERRQRRDVSRHVIARGGRKKKKNNLPDWPPVPRDPDGRI